MIDDNELARLEKLASAGYGGPFIDLTSLNNSEIRGAIPALVAEVRRLREWQSADKRTIAAFSDGNKELLERVRELGQENAALREKVEAWEWWDEVADLNEDTFWCSFLSRSAANEMCDTYLAAREAVNADRE